MEFFVSTTIILYSSSVCLYLLKNLPPLRSADSVRSQLQQIVREAIAAGDESARGLGDISWTPSMRRLYALLAQVRVRAGVPR